MRKSLTIVGSEVSKEHIWLGSIEKVNDKYYGIVVNDPFYIKSMKFGDKVEFDINKISDWKYVKDGFLVGGQSISLSIYSSLSMLIQSIRDEINIILNR